ncbi:hypothetical protein PROFUN_02439 [Planoprotostelium fungivorum]|uniref:THH1/TOM1/TOM3 domain-containing protein n=1 Tax=Planoprotostelium fungivorum TaxID=1890364 RepID=A0A2P6NUV3_9EUKA|nr:hypothetical protein PROFUN_02439 [Planoprotostelium fungivorum]
MMDCHYQSPSQMDEQRYLGNKEIERRYRSRSDPSGWFTCNAPGNPTIDPNYSIHRHVDLTVDDEDQWEDRWDKSAPPPTTKRTHKRDHLEQKKSTQPTTFSSSSQKKRRAEGLHHDRGVNKIANKLNMSSRPLKVRLSNKRKMTEERSVRTSGKKIRAEKEKEKKSREKKKEEGERKKKKEEGEKKRREEGEKKRREEEEKKRREEEIYENTVMSPLHIMAWQSMKSNLAYEQEFKTRELVVDHYLRAERQSPCIWNGAGIGKSKRRFTCGSTRALEIRTGVLKASEPRETRERRRVTRPDWTSISYIWLQMILAVTGEMLVLRLVGVCIIRVQQIVATATGKTASLLASYFRRTHHLDMMRQLLRCLVWAAFISHVASTLPPTSVEYTVKSAEALGTAMSFAQFSVVYNETLYYPEVTVCPTCAPQPITDCICDYTKQNACQLCTKCDASLCSRYDEKWTLLQDGVTLVGQTLGPSQTANYRFQLTGSSCSSLDVRVLSEYGNAVLLMDNRAPVTDTEFIRAVYFPDAILGLVQCAFEPSHKLGTYFLMVQAAATDVKFNITARSITPAEGDDTPPPCSPTLPDYSCIIPGVVETKTTDVAGFAELRQYNITRCEQISVAVYTDVDVDFYYDFDDVTPTTDGYWGSNNYGNDETAMFVCPSDFGRDWVMLNLFFNVWELNSNNTNTYSIVLRTNHTRDTLRLKRFDQVSYYQSRSLQSMYIARYNGTSSTCLAWQFGCINTWTLFPSTDSIPFYPVFSLLLRTGLWENLILNDTQISFPPAANVLSFAVLLNYTYNGVDSVFLDESQLSDVSVTVGPRIFSESSRGARAVYYPEKKVSECNYGRFSIVQNRLKRQLAMGQNTTLFPVLVASEISTASLAYSNDYYGCKALVQVLLDYDNSSVQLVNTTECVSPYLSDNYNADPCCSRLGRWDSDCVSRLVQIPSSRAQTNASTVSSLCGRGGDTSCVTSALADYLFISQTGSCTSSDGYNTEDYDLYRSCKDEYFSREALSCVSDADCTTWNNKCDVQRRTCVVDRERQGREFIACLLSSMNTLQKTDLATSWGLIYTDENSMIDRYYNLTLSMDCRPIPFTEPEAKYSLTVINAVCAGNYNCPSLSCEDSSCLIEENVCLNWCFDKVWEPQASVSSADCASSFTCNVNPAVCSNLTRSQCTTACTSQGDFCGWSEDGGNTYVKVLPQSTSSNCTGQICIVPNPIDETYQVYDNVTVAGCSEMGSCSLPCNLNAQPPGSSTDRLCQNERECENSGYCSVNSLIVGGGAEGACAMNRIYPATNTPWAAIFRLPFCLAPIEVDIPNSCLTYIYNASTCNGNSTGDRGGERWLVPYMTKESCEAEKGCYDVVSETASVGVNYAFTGKDQTSCLRSGATWKNHYTWTSGKWSPAVTRSVQWTSPSVTNSNTFRSGLNFKSAQDIFFQVIEGTGTSNVIKNSAVCRASTSDYLDVISCSCGTGGSSQCYSSLPAAIPSGKGSMCSNTTGTLTGDNNFIRYNENSVALGCISVVLSTVSSLQFLGKKMKTVPPFIDTRQSRTFSVENGRGVTIGVLQGDGVAIAYDSPVLGTVQVCIGLRDIGADSQSYTTFDFARSDSSLTGLTPMNVNVSMIQVSSGRFLCSEILNSSINQMYFPIVRVREWREATLLDTAPLELVLADILGSFYILTAALAFIVSCIILYITLKKKREYVINDCINPFIFAFCVIRGIYFLSSLDGVVTTFVLIALPHFLHFTAFTLIVLFWMVMAGGLLSVTPKGIFRLGVRLVIIVNAILYILFIVLLITFYEISKGIVNECGGRSLSAFNSLNHKDQIVSLTYAIAIAVISLVMGVLFIIYGLRLYSLMLENDTRGTTPKKVILTNTIVFSVTFILHSIFIIIIFTVNNISPIFSFVGLALTELLPCLYFTYNTFNKIGGFVFIGRTISSCRRSLLDETRGPNQPQANNLRMTDLRGGSTAQSLQSQNTIEASYESSVHGDSAVTNSGADQSTSGEGPASVYGD